jgi:transglutaminase-like putative cysteine protease
MRNRLHLLALAATLALVAAVPPLPTQADGVYSAWQKKEYKGQKWWECLYVYEVGCRETGCKRVVVYPPDDPRSGWVYFCDEDGSPLLRYAIPGNPLYDPRQIVRQHFDRRSNRWEGSRPPTPAPAPATLKPEPKPDPKPQPDPKPEPRPQPKPDPKPELKPEPRPDPKPELKPEPEPQPRPALLPAGATRFAGEHRLRVFDIPEGTKRLQVWYWLPMETPLQKVLTLSLKESPEVCRLVTDNVGNRYLYAEVANPGKELAIAYDFEVDRARVEPQLANVSGIRYDPLYQKLFAAYLDTTPASGLRMTTLVKNKTKEVVGDETDPVRVMRKIFDYSSNFVHYLRPSNLKKDQDDPSRVVSTVEDDQNPEVNQKADRIDGTRRDARPNNYLDTPDAGDPEYCINTGGGGCTDIHAVVLAMARLNGIPARHLFGSRVDKSMAGRPYKPGYQCMIEFYIPGHGWLPMNPTQAGNESDGKEAEEAARIKAAHFGGMDADRIIFFEGRNVTLGTGVAGEEGHRAPLFIGAVVLADGKTFKNFKRTFNLKP